MDKYRKLTETTHLRDVYGDIHQVTSEMWYVIGNDKILSYRGGAEGKISKRIVICNDYQQASRVADNMRKDNFIYVSCKKAKWGLPYYMPSRYRVCVNHVKDCPIWDK